MSEEPISVSEGDRENEDVVVECRKVSVGYGEELVVRDVDLSVRRGEIVALLGGSGSGKSTLLKAITGLLRPRSGEVRLFGRPLHDVDQDERNALLRRTGMVFQQDALFGSMTVLDNVALPLRELTHLPAPVIQEMARMKLALVGLDGLEDRLPSGISGGQRKRAALARASVLDPEVIFCDEPSAGLDPVVAASIDETLLRFRDVLHITIIAVTHELESIRTIADRAVMLGEGGILASGTIDELSRSEEPYVHDFFHRVADERAGQPGDAVAQLRQAG
jgi:phospholipid/cholesterol/gamma-HCH transport system ATP-binding protein